MVLFIIKGKYNRNCSKIICDDGKNTEKSPGEFAKMSGRPCRPYENFICLSFNQMTLNEYASKDPEVAESLGVAVDILKKRVKGKTVEQIYGEHYRNFVHNCKEKSVFRVCRMDEELPELGQAGRDKGLFARNPEKDLPLDAFEYFRLLNKHIRSSPPQSKFISATKSFHVFAWYSMFGILPYVTIDLSKVTDTDRFWDLCDETVSDQILYGETTIYKGYAQVSKEVVFECHVPAGAIMRPICKREVLGGNPVASITSIHSRTEHEFPKHLDIDANTLPVILDGSTQPVKISINKKMYVLKRSGRFAFADQKEVLYTVSQSHAVIEFFSNAVYTLSRIGVPSAALYKIMFEINGQKMFASVLLNEFVEGEHPGKSESWNEDIRKQMKDGLITDSLLHNADVSGPEFTNMLVTSDNKLYRIDNGGTLWYKPKGSYQSIKQGIEQTLQMMINGGTNEKAHMNRRQMYKDLSSRALFKMIKDTVDLDLHNKLMDWFAKCRDVPFEWMDSANLIGGHLEKLRAFGEDKCKAILGGNMNEASQLEPIPETASK